MIDSKKHKMKQHKTFTTHRLQLMNVSLSEYLAASKHTRLNTATCLAQSGVHSDFGGVYMGPLGLVREERGVV